MGDIGVQEKGQNHIADLKSSYEKKKRETIRDGETQLHAIKEKYKEEIDQVREQDEAVINHITKGHEKQVGQIQAQNREQIKALRETVDENVHKQYLDQEGQNKKLQEAQKAYQTQANKQYQKMAEGLGEIRAQQNQKDLTARKKIQSTQEVYDQEIENQTKANQDKLKAIRKSNADAVDQEIQAGTSQHNHVRTQSQENLRKEKLETDKKLSEFQKSTNAMVNKEKVTGHQRVEEILKINQDKMISANKTAEKELAENKKKFEDNEIKQEAYHRAEIVKQKKDQEERIGEIEKNQKLETEKKFQEYKTRMDEKHRDFLQQYDLADRQNKQSMFNQKENILRALRNQQKEIVSQSKQYGSIKDDPFYKINDYETELKEYKDSYVFTTELPEYDKKNVQVRVHPDKVILSGARSFEDKITNPKTQAKTATNSYQTFHQEYNLKHPAKEKEITQLYEDGVLSVHIPKA